MDLVVFIDIYFHSMIFFSLLNSFLFWFKRSVAKLISRSIPTHSKPRSLHAILVVPLPKKGSNTIPSGGVIKVTKYLINLSGLIVGCRQPFFSEEDALDVYINGII